MLWFLTAQLLKLRKSAKAKLRHVGGFSLSELLLTMLIILLMTQLTVDGIPAVRRAYNRAVDAANAEVYLNTTIVALRSRLSLASKVNATGLSYDVYLDPAIGYYTIANNSDKGIVIQPLNIDMVPSGQPYPLLVGEEGFISSYGTDDDKIQYNPNKAFFTITNLTVKKGGEEFAKLDSYIVHTVNPKISVS